MGFRGKDFLDIFLSTFSCYVFFFLLWVRTGIAEFFICYYMNVCRYESNTHVFHLSIKYCSSFVLAIFYLLLKNWGQDDDPSFSIH